jgi:hypothetical protein
VCWLSIVNNHASLLFTLRCRGEIFYFGVEQHSARRNATNPGNYLVALKAWGWERGEGEGLGWGDEFNVYSPR